MPEFVAESTSTYAPAVVPERGWFLARTIIDCIFASFACLLVCGQIGCSTHAKRLATPRNHFYDGRLDECKEGLEKLSKSRHDKDVVNLDLAMVDLLSGKPKISEQRLKLARNRFEALESESLTEKTVSMWTDDQVRSYAGEDYEKILIHAFLALTNLLSDGADAESYTLQLQAKHEELVQACAERTKSNTQPSYTPLPLGFYLRGMLREATLRDYDDAIRNY
jgi:hypothetical protein